MYEEIAPIMLHIIPNETMLEYGIFNLHIIITSATDNGTVRRETIANKLWLSIFKNPNTINIKIKMKL